MAKTKLLTNATVDGVGTEVTTGSEMAIYGLELQGFTDGAFIDIIIDVEQDGVWTRAGGLDTHNAAKLIMLPAECKVTAKLSGATKNTNVTVVIAG